MVKQKHNMDVNPQRLMITQHAHTQNHQTFTLGAFKVNMTLFTAYLSPVSSEQHITRSNGFVLTLKKGLKHADRQAFVREVNVWLRFNLCRNPDLFQFIWASDSSLSCYQRPSQDPSSIYTNQHCVWSKNNIVCLYRDKYLSFASIDYVQWRVNSIYTC